MGKAKMTEKTFELIKGMLIHGYSIKKVEQMLPDEIMLSDFTIRKVDKCATFDEYCGKKEDPPAP